MVLILRLISLIGLCLGVDVFNGLGLAVEVFITGLGLGVDGLVLVQRLTIVETCDPVFGAQDVKGQRQVVKYFDLQ